MAAPLSSIGFNREAAMTRRRDIDRRDRGCHCRAGRAAPPRRAIRTTSSRLSCRRRRARRPTSWAGSWPTAWRPQLGQRFVVLNKAGRQRHPRHRRGRPRQARRLHADAWRGLLDHRAAADRAADRLHRAIRSTPICQTFKNDQVIVARPGTYKTLADLMAASKAKPGGLNYGTPGPRHDPASVDGRAVADQQGRSSTTCRSGDRPSRSR